MNIVQQAISLTDRMAEREKYWQEKAGRMAVIANAMYHYVSEKNLSEDEIDELHSMYKEILEMLLFDEESNFSLHEYQPVTFLGG